MTQPDRRDPRPVANQFSSLAMSHLGAVSAQYATVADEYKPLRVAAAEAEAAHTNARAKFKIAVQLERERMSVAEAETRADADDTIGELLTRKLVTRALADSCLEKLRQLRTQNDNGRSYQSAERELDRLHADSRTGFA